MPRVALSLQLRLLQHVMVGAHISHLAADRDGATPATPLLKEQLTMPDSGLKRRRLLRWPQRRQVWPLSTGDGG